MLPAQILRGVIEKKSYYIYTGIQDYQRDFVASMNRYFM